MAKILEEDLIELTDIIDEANRYYKSLYENIIRLSETVMLTDEDFARLDKFKRILDKKFDKINKPKSMEHLEKNIKVGKIYKDGEIKTYVRK